MLMCSTAINQCSPFRMGKERHWEEVWPDWGQNKSKYFCEYIMRSSRFLAYKEIIKFKKFESMQAWKFIVAEDSLLIFFFSHIVTEHYHVNNSNWLHPIHSNNYLYINTYVPKRNCYKRILWHLMTIIIKVSCWIDKPYLSSKM